MIGALVVAAVVVLVCAPTSFAVGIVDRENQTIAVTPSVIEQEVARTEPTTIPITIRNQTDEGFRFRLTIEDFDPVTAAESRGSITTTEGGVQSARTWLSLDRQGSFAIAPHSSATVPLRIVAPDNADPGGHYAAVIVHVLPRGTTVPITTRISILALLTVPGAIQRDLRISVEPERVFDFSAPFNWKIVVTNYGNVHEDVGGKLSVEPLFGGSASLQLPSLVVLPGVTRVFPVAVPTANAPNFLTPNISVRDWRHDQKLNAITSVSSGVLAPLWSILTIFVTVIVLIIRIRTRNHDRYDEPEDLDQAKDL